MKSIFLMVSCLCFSGLLNAQVRPKTNPAIKQTQIVKTDTNQVIKQHPVVSTIKRISPKTVNENLLFYTWKITRWGHSNVWGDYQLTASNFKFNANGTVTCDASIITPGDKQLLNGVYTVSGNNVNIKIKQDNGTSLTCNLDYDNINKILKGYFFLEISSGFAAGNGTQGEMNMEISQ